MYLDMGKLKAHTDNNISGNQSKQWFS